MRPAPSWELTRSNEDQQGDELGTYVALLRTAVTEHGITYGPRGLELRSLGSSRGRHAPPGRTRESSTGPSEAVGFDIQNEGGTRDARRWTGSGYHPGTGKTRITPNKPLSGTVQAEL